MKIEIDFSKPDDLRTMKRELEMALSTIETAIAAIGRNGVDPKQPQLIQLPPSPVATAASDVLSKSPVGIIVDQLPNDFTMSDIFSAAKEKSIPRSRARSEISELVETGVLILVEKGQGRRPSKFRKA